MKLLGRDIAAEDLLARIEARLQARGLSAPSHHPVSFEGVEARVDPLSFNLASLEQNADPTVPLPLQSHRKGLSRALVLGGKWAFRKAFQLFVNEALGRQRHFNLHVRDSYAQLSAEVLRLREEVEALRAEKAKGTAGSTATAAAESGPKSVPRPSAGKPATPRKAKS